MNKSGCEDCEGLEYLGKKERIVFPIYVCKEDPERRTVISEANINLLDYIPRPRWCPRTCPNC